MRVKYQVAIDCADPHQLARFWSEALHWPVEDHSDMIKQLLEQEIATEDDVMIVDGRLAWKTAAAVRDEDAPERGRLLFQQVPEPKTVKNRVHLDLRLDVPDRDAEVQRLISLGATKLWDGREGHQTWVTLADPEGNEFCIA
jgi:Glyoxalase-like domain